MLHQHLVTGYWLRTTGYLDCKLLPSFEPRPKKGRLGRDGLAVLGAGCVVAPKSGMGILPMSQTPRKRAIGPCFHGQDARATPQRNRLPCLPQDDRAGRLWHGPGPSGHGSRVDGTENCVDVAWGHGIIIEAARDGRGQKSIWEIPGRKGRRRSSAGGYSGDSGREVRVKRPSVEPFEQPSGSFRFWGSSNQRGVQR